MFFDLASALVEVIPVAVSNLSQVYANLEACWDLSFSMAAWQYCSSEGAETPVPDLCLCQAPHDTAMLVTGCWA